MKNFESIFAAYLIGWIIFFAYYATIARRLSRAEGELRRLKDAIQRR